MDDGTGRRPRRRVRLLLAAVTALLGAALVAVALSGSGDDRTDGDVAAGERQCDLLAPAEARACHARRVLVAVSDQDPQTAVRTATRMAATDRGRLRSDCHLVMHAVGRRYASDRGFDVGALRDVLPRSDDASCAAGFAHGLIMAVAPGIDPADPGGVARRTCATQATRVQRYSCMHGFGHAYMRVWDGVIDEALAWCRETGDRAPECAQGVFHDHWLAFAGKDDAATRSAPAGAGPADVARRLCGAQPDGLTGACWYRAFIDTRPRGYTTRTVAELLEPCAGLQGRQRAACVTATSVIGPANPLTQMRLCSAVPRATDQVACVTGVKAQNLDPAADRDHMRLLRRCRWTAPDARDACFRRIATVLTVTTNGRFARTGGCDRVEGGAARAACREGLAAIEEPLEAFN